ncbi:MAG TPA: POTRA domain-containing protein, partial [Telluria sp.]
MPQKAAPKLTVAPVDAAATPADAAGMKISVARLNIAGSRVYAESVLLQEAGFVPGSQLSLADLRAMAAKIAAFYHRNG